MPSRSSRLAALVARRNTILGVILKPPSGRCWLGRFVRRPNRIVRDTLLISTLRRAPEKCVGRLEGFLGKYLFKTNCATPLSGVAEDGVLHSRKVPEFATSGESSRPATASSGETG
jgi:hypothetical protein